MQVSAISATAIVLPEDFFGVAYNRLVANLMSQDKATRKDAFNGIKAIVKGAGLITEGEKILSIGLGANLQGVKVITVVVEAPPMKIEATAMAPMAVS